MRSIAAELNVTDKWNAIIRATTKSSHLFSYSFPVYVAGSFPRLLSVTWLLGYVDCVSVTGDKIDFDFVASRGDKIGRISDKVDRKVDFLPRLATESTRSILSRILATM